MAESDAPFDRWHKRYPKDGDKPCRCGTKKNPLYPSADHGRGQRWQARYTDPMGKPRRPNFDSWEEARDHLSEVRTKIRKSTWVPPDAGRKTLEYHAKKMIERRYRNIGKDDDTTYNYEGIYRLYVLPFLGQRNAATLRRSDTRDLMDFVGEHDLGATYVHQIFKTWRVLVNYMVDEDVELPANIVSRIDLPEINPRVEVVLEPEQVEALAAAMRDLAPRYEIIVWVAACAGLRKSECIGLRRKDINWDASLLYVLEQRPKGRAKKLKTKSSKATLPVDQFLMSKFREHVSAFPPVRNANADTTDLLVTTARGCTVTHYEFNRWWKKAKEIAGVPADTRLHDLKHFYTTRLQGAHAPKTVQALSRHSKFATTWDTYAHPPDAAEGVQVTVFSQMFQQPAKLTLVPTPDAPTEERLTPGAPNVQESMTS